jgi:hypothetical protein
MRQLGLMLALVLVAACNRVSRVEVTVRTDELPSDRLARVQVLAVSISGDETAEHRYNVKSPLQMQRLVYHPLSTSSKLLVQISALDGAQGVLVATGQAHVALNGGAVPATISLHVPVPVKVTPSKAAIPAGSTLQLSANVPVQWSIREAPNGGTVDANGLYVAPAHAGQFHVIATSGDDITQSATTTVSSLELDLVAGQLGGGSGLLDGVGLAARFNAPWPVAADLLGNLYVGDLCAVRRVRIASGKVETMAGSSVCGAAKDGTAEHAQFQTIEAITTDVNNDVYLIDANGDQQHAAVLRKLTVATGQVTTIAGGASQPGDGTGSAAGFNFPLSMAVGADHNVYVADSCALRQVRPTDGHVATVVGDAAQVDCHVLDQTGTSARIGNAQALALDATSGNWYLADSQTIRRITATFDVKTLAGVEGAQGNTDGIGTVARFTGPSGMALDSSGILYISDVTANLIRRMTLGDNYVITLAGGSVGHLDGVGAAGQLGAPLGIAFSSVSSPSLYIVESDNFDVRQLNLASRQLSAFVGNAGNYGDGDGIGAQASFWLPSAVVEAAPGMLFVADDLNATIRQVDQKTGQVDTVAGLPTQPGAIDGTGSIARLKSPATLTADSAGHVYVGDAGRVRVLDTATHALTTLAGSDAYGCAAGTGANAQLKFVTGLALDGNGHLYVLDNVCHTLSWLDLGTHAVTLLAGAPGVGGHVDGAGSVARLDTPSGMVFDGQGTLYIDDNTTVRAWSIASQMMSTIAGSGAVGYVDGTGTAAQFHHLGGLAFDGQSTLYAADGTTIRMIALLTGVVTTFAGSPADYSQVKLGPLPATLNAPGGLIFTADRNLVFTDFQENALLTIRGPL